MSSQEYEDICNTFNLSDSSRKSLLNYLHNIGILFYREDLFENKIILDQTWAIEAIYSLSIGKNYFLI